MVVGREGLLNGLPSSHDFALNFIQIGLRKRDRVTPELGFGLSVFASEVEKKNPELPPECVRGSQINEELFNVHRIDVILETTSRFNFPNNSASVQVRTIFKSEFVGMPTPGVSGFQVELTGISHDG